MWGRRKTKTFKVRGHVGGFLDETSELEGRYTCTGTVLLDAKFTGEITAKDTLVIGEQAVVHATVQAASCVVRGEVVGNVTASERVELKAGARVTGDIEAPTIVMEEGAVHDGQCRMTKPTSPEVALAVVVPCTA